MLELYQFEGCPFCAKVRQTLSDLHLDYICRNIPRDATEKREQFVKLTGKMQVPCLMDKEKDLIMFESDDIINYLKENHK
jgi:glutathione S-transferase